MSDFQQFCERYELDQNSVKAEAEWLESRRQLERLTRAADANESLEREQPAALQQQRYTNNTFAQAINHMQTRSSAQTNEQQSINEDALRRFVDIDDQKQTKRVTQNDDSDSKLNRNALNRFVQQNDQQQNEQQKQEDTGPSPRPF